MALDTAISRSKENGNGKQRVPMERLGTINAKASGKKG